MSAEVVLGVSGGIAAYKACELLRLLTGSGHRVRVVPTAAALRFVGVPTWAALSGQPVATDVFDDVHEVPHVRLGQHADLVVVAPATADLLARAANGHADDLLTSTLLTARCPVLFAPAMHTEMWEHPATVANVATLRLRGAVVLDPAVGRLTGADTGKGRLADPGEIFAIARRLLARGAAALTPDLAGRHVVVTAGGTREPLDPVRFLGNRSSGKQGYAFAQSALARGARVTLISANVALPDPAGAEVIRVGTTEELRAATLAAAARADAVVMAAAPCDFRPARYQPEKIKKRDDGSPPQEDFETIRITVAEINLPPSLGPIGDQVIDEGLLFTLPVSATDADVPSNTLTFTLDPGSPPGAQINPMTGVFTWTPTESQGPGTYPITVRVRDDGSPAGEDFETITFTVREVNQPPVLAAIGSQTIQEGSQLSFTAPATDPDDPPNSLSFSLDLGASASAQIDPVTGGFSWTPTAPGMFDVTVRVTDNGTPSLDDFETVPINVTACPFRDGLPGWTTTESGGSETGKGTVMADVCHAVMTEGDSFVVTLATVFVVPAAPTPLTFSFSDLQFDTSDPNFINDAFEVALVDPAGVSLVQTFSAGRDAFFNITEGQSAALGQGTSFNAIDQTVTVDLSGVFAGTTGRWPVRSSINCSALTTACPRKWLFVTTNTRSAFASNSRAASTHIASSSRE